MKERIRRVHFVGIGGIGMSGIAELLFNQGFAVTGCDLSENRNTERLAALGVPIAIGHDPAHVQDADLVVITSAVGRDHPEAVAARAAGIPVIPRAEMLAELMRMKRGIAVAGSHGKTTITSMIAHAMEAAGLDPTYVIGGRLMATGRNARLGASDWLVAEADESDGSFLRLSPQIAVIANIDREHMNHYGSMDALVAAFRDFALRTPFYGRVILHHEHPNLARIREDLPRPVWTYGKSPQADFALVARRPAPTGQTITVAYAGKKLGELRLQLFGAHNAENALAALAALLEAGLSFAEARKGIESFAGIERRFQLARIQGGVLIDDYAHHPREIEAVLAAARECFADARLVAIFQPHRYSRTQDLWDAFLGAFDLADEVHVLPIYAASEAPIAGVDHERLATAMRARGHRGAGALPDLDAACALASAKLQTGAVVLMLGAGSIGRAAARLREEAACAG